MKRSTQLRSKKRARTGFNTNGKRTDGLSPYCGATRGKSLVNFNRKINNNPEIPNRRAKYQRGEV